MEINTVQKNNGMSGVLCSYQVTYKNTNIQRSVPLDTANTDYKDILEWEAIDGNTILEAD